MIRQPKIVLTYIYAVGGADGYRAKAMQFVDTYFKHPPELHHETLIVCNGVPCNDDTRSIFAGMPGLMYLDRDDSGWDIGGFQHAARAVPADMMIFCGGHTYFRRRGWLVRMWEAFQEKGDTLYGSTGNQGNIPGGIHPHVRTTGFWCSTSLFNQYPHVITSQGGGGQRYEMEHGVTCLTNWIRNAGLVPWIVGWHDMKPITECDSIANGYHQGRQENVLVGDRLCCPPFYPFA